MPQKYREEIYHCLKCGACRTGFPVYEPICPSGVRFGFDSHYAIGRLEIARNLLEGGLEMTSSLMERIYTCSSCGACDVQCDPAVGVGPLKVIEELKYLAVENGTVPPRVRDFLKGMMVRGNPFMQPAEQRGDWAKGLGLEQYNGHEYLLYIGCVGSYDEVGQHIARTVANIMNSAGLSFGILGALEQCDGNEVNRVGERGLFEMMAQANIKQFDELGVKKVITISPHAYNAFNNEYVKMGCDFEVMHATQLMEQLTSGARLSPNAGVPVAWELSWTANVAGKMAKEDKSREPGEKAVKVTFHDPCFLGRHNGEYEAPRRVLESLPGVTLVEMERNRKNAFCCGGGGGNFFTDMLGGSPLSPSRVRVREAHETGAEVIAVACPNCARMLDDALKDEGLDEQMTVKDVSELVEEMVL